MTLINGLDLADKSAPEEEAKEPVFRPVQPDQEDARIKVIGVGGGGGNATQRMERGLADNVEVFCVNTDAQVLRGLKVGQPVQIGRETTKGLGAGARPQVGREAAKESRDILAGLVENADMLFITAGMGGGTGTGAAPVIAELAKEAGALTVAVVTRPFEFEGQHRCSLAEEGIRELAAHVDSIITIPNDRLMSELPEDISMEDAFIEADRVLYGAVRGISDLILRPGVINLDFADVRTVMAQQGMAMMGTGVAEGPNRAAEATKQAISCRLLDEVNITDARAMLVNVTTTSKGLGLAEHRQVADELKPLQAKEAEVVMGTTYDDSMGDQLKVTIVVAGFGVREEPKEGPSPTATTGGAPRWIAKAPRRISGSAAGAGEREPRAEKVAPAPTLTEGNLARDTRDTGWSKAGKFDVPSYLRKQHD